MNLFLSLLIFGKYIIYFAILSALVMAVCYLIKTPSNDRTWVFGQQKTASISIDKNKLVTIENMRDFDWSQVQENSQGNNQQTYKNVQFKLTDLKSMQLAVSHFSAISEIAHVFLMFELNNEQKFGFSIEARRQQGDKYSLIGGLFAKFELIYLFATEDDLIGVRKNRDEKVFLYPTKASPTEIQDIFIKIMEKTNDIAVNPELYHLFFKNCTTGVVDLVSHISDLKYPMLVQAFMPGDAGKALYKMGLIDTDEKDFESVRQAALVK